MYSFQTSRKEIAGNKENPIKKTPEKERKIKKNHGIQKYKVRR